MKLVSQSPQPFNAVFYCNKLGTKDRGLNCCLLLGDPIDQGRVEENQDAGARASSERIAGMVTVAHHSDLDFFGARWGHIVRDGFTNVM